MNYIVFDLEATCEESNRNFPNETIEIGAVKLDANFNIVDTYTGFIRPKLNPILTEFCKNLTTITQAEVDNAPDFPMGVELFKEWIGVGRTDYLLCSWGYYDRTQLERDSRLHKLDPSWASKHISLKHQFAEIRNIRPCGMAKALKALNIPLDGTHHRGIDDAKNIAKIFIAYKDKWNLNPPKGGL